MHPPAPGCLVLVVKFASGTEVLRTVAVQDARGAFQTALEAHGGVWPTPSQHR